MCSRVEVDFTTSPKLWNNLFYCNSYKFHQIQNRQKAGFFCSFPSYPRRLFLLKKYKMAEPQFISRNLALKEFELKDSPNGKQVTFSIKFAKKNGEIEFIPRAVAAGLRFSMCDNCMRGILPVDADNNASGHVTPVHIDGILEWNGKKIKF